MLTFPPKRILAPIDLSEVSFSAWLQANVMAEKFHAELDTVHVREFLPAILSEDQKRKLTQKRKNEILSLIRSRIGDVPRVQVLEGDAVVTILRLARTKRPDMIVMGSHGLTGYDRVLLGSVSEAVVRRSPVPVLTTRRNPHPIRSILVPVNFTPYANTAFEYAAQVACAVGARLTALYVSSGSPEEWEPQYSLKELLRKLPGQALRICDPQILALEGNPVEKILRTAKHHDLVVLAAHQKSMINDYVLGTTAERVLRYSPVPVLSVPSPKPALKMPKEPWTVAMPPM